MVTNSGILDKSEVYLYDGQKIIEIRNGSGTMVQQFIHGTQYIDELVMVRVKDKGDLYVHQDANWNVIGTTDLGRHLVEREVYSPYGELTVHQSAGFGDRDGDGDVDSTDKGTVGTTCTGTVTGTCRILDLDFDGDYDSTDASSFDWLPQGLQRTPGRLASAVQQPFAHQGLLFEPEIGSYQNRARQYDPAKRRFMQRDPLILRLRLPNARYLYPAGLNSYTRTLLNPLYSLDPTGLCDFNPEQCQANCIAHEAQCVAESEDTEDLGECMARTIACKTDCGNAAADQAMGGGCPPDDWDPWDDGPWDPYAGSPSSPCLPSVGTCQSADQAVGVVPGSPCTGCLSFLTAQQVPGAPAGCCGCQ